MARATHAPRWPVLAGLCFGKHTAPAGVSQLLQCGVFLYTAASVPPLAWCWRGVAYGNCEVTHITARINDVKTMATNIRNSMPIEQAAIIPDDF